MPLVSIPFPEVAQLAAQIDIPEDIEALICEGERRIDAFIERTRAAPMLSFVPSDFRATYRGLVWLWQQRLATGRTLCEWGSGFGVVAMLASKVGFYASGIEVEPVLVDESVALARDFQLEVEFVAGSFIPEDSLESSGQMEELDWLDYNAPAAYEELGYDVDDFDVIFAYPWPGEQHLVHELFEEHASAGALMLTFQGAEGLRLHRLDRANRRR